MYKTTNNNPSFKSRIVFVSPKTYERIHKSLKNNADYKNINTWNVRCHSFEANWQGEQAWCGWRENVEAGVTAGVRSCTAGLAIKKGQPAPLFWHIEDTVQNYDNLKDLKPLIKGSNAVIIGSKSFFPLSSAIFNKFKRYAKRNNLALTYFQDLTKKWEAHLAYRAKDDTVFLCVNNIEEPRKYVKSQKTLNNAFSKIKISQTDTVEFHSPFKEFLLHFNLFNKNRFSY